MPGISQRSESTTPRTRYIGAVETSLLHFETRVKYKYYYITKVKCWDDPRKTQFLSRVGADWTTFRADVYLLQIKVNCAYIN
ncbi:hypothetical protein T05_5805 [Trichinella murrelli]|uniref:Uncharacterized protein n=1 Tax=Trichinella murrelli TaxID=144512 RepID=A0A0V0UI16_9BILA|nr:hypothetical protein T05_5805 [Trichinella murrelli]